MKSLFTVKTIFLTLLCLLSMADTALAQSMGRIGTEMTVTNSKFIEAARHMRGEEYQEIFDLTFANYMKKVKLLCSTCELFDLSVDQLGYSKVSVRLPSGLVFFVHSDDWVVEIGSKPLTEQEIKDNLGLIQNVVFDALAAAGMYPHERIGGGHVHLEIASFFGTDAKLFRNFVVDLMNRPELFLGGFALDLLNAPPLAILKPHQTRAFAKIVSDFDRSPFSIAEFKRRMNAEVYTESFITGSSDDLEHFRNNQSKYQGVNFLHEHTLEIRGRKPQTSALDLLDFVHVLRSRIDYLSANNAPIPYLRRDLRRQVRWTVQQNVESYEVLIPAEKIYAELERYIRDAHVTREISTSSMVTSELARRLGPRMCQAHFSAM